MTGISSVNSSSLRRQVNFRAEQAAQTDGSAVQQTDSTQSQPTQVKKSNLVKYIIGGGVLALAALAAIYNKDLGKFLGLIKKEAPKVETPAVSGAGHHATAATKNAVKNTATKAHHVQASTGPAKGETPQTHEADPSPRQRIINALHARVSGNASNETSGKIPSVKKTRARKPKSSKQIKPDQGPQVRKQSAWSEFCQNRMTEIKTLRSKMSDRINAATTAISNAKARVYKSIDQAEAWFDKYMGRQIEPEVQTAPKINSVPKVEPESALTPTIEELKTAPIIDAAPECMAESVTGTSGLSRLFTGLKNQGLELVSKCITMGKTHVRKLKTGKLFGYSKEIKIDKFHSGSGLGQLDDPVANDVLTRLLEDSSQIAAKPVAKKFSLGKNFVGLNSIKDQGLAYAGGIKTGLNRLGETISDITAGVTAKIKSMKLLNRVEKTEESKPNFIPAEKFKAEPVPQVQAAEVAEMPKVQVEETPVHEVLAPVVNDGFKFSGRRIYKLPQEHIFPETTSFSNSTPASRPAEESAVKPRFIETMSARLSGLVPTKASISNTIQNAKARGLEVFSKIKSKAEPNATSVPTEAEAITMKVNEVPVAAEQESTKPANNGGIRDVLRRLTGIGANKAKAASDAPAPVAVQIADMTSRQVEKDPFAFLNTNKVQRPIGSV